MNKYLKLSVTALALILALCVSSGALAQDTIRIGALYPLSGPMALLGNHDMNGVMLATEITNEQGGIGGKKIELVKADAPTEAAAESEAERLINVEHLNVLIGTYSSSLSFVASSVAEKYHKIYWETGAIADAITQRGFKYLFRTCSQASDFGNAAADYATQKLAPQLGIPIKDLKVCIMHEDSLFGTSTMGAAEKRLQSLGVKVLAKESYSKSVTDLSPLVMKFKSLQPDFVLATCYANDAILWERQMKELNLNIKAMIGSGGGHGLLDFAKATGSDSDGVFSGDFPLIKNPKSLDPNLDPPLQTVFVRYKQKYGDFPDLHAMSGFTGAWVFYHYVLNKAGSTDPEAIRKAAYQVDIPEGSTHMGWGVKFKPEGDPEAGQNSRAFAVMMQWQVELNYCVWPERYAEREAILVPLPKWKDRN